MRATSQKECLVELGLTYYGGAKSGGEEERDKKGGGGRQNGGMMGDCAVCFHVVTENPDVRQALQVRFLLEGGGR